MTIKFACEHCGEQVKAPDDAGGKRGKCHYCGQSVTIPLQQEDSDTGEIPLAPLDEEQEQHYKETIDELMKQEHDILAFKGSAVPAQHSAEPQTSSSAADDPNKLVIKYCRNMAGDKPELAAGDAQQLRQLGPDGARAVSDFAKGKTIDIALDVIPARELKRILSLLKNELK